MPRMSNVRPHEGDYQAMDMFETRKKIRANSDLVVQQLGPHSNISFGLNRASVEWVDGFIERQRQRPELDDQARSGLVNRLGSFLGECLVANTSGAWAWVESQGTLGVQFPTGNCAFPFAKVAKQFENGREGGDSVLGLFDTVLAMSAAGKL